MLRSATILVNFLALIAAIWLGVYILTRSPRRLISWLTGLTLWTLAGVFVNVLMALDPPPPGVRLPAVLRIVFPFWPQGIPEQPSGWLQGWSVMPAVVLWHHATTMMRPGSLNTSRWVRILAGYFIAGVAIVLQAFTPMIFTVEGAEPLYVNTLRAGPYYPFFATCLLIFSWWSLVNLLRSAHEAPHPFLRRQFQILAGATLLAGLAGALSIAGSAMGLAIPMLALTFPLGISVGLMGVGVARYSALVDGRTIRRDFTYNLVAIGLVILVYLAFTNLLASIYQIPFIVPLLVVLLAIITHSLTGSIRRALDGFFFRGRALELRGRLQALAQRVGERQGIDRYLQQALEPMCEMVRATYGLILIHADHQVKLLVGYRWRDPLPRLVENDFKADDVDSFEPGQYPPPFEEAALHIPLYADDEQIGSLILGRPANGIRYAQSDIDLLLHPSDRIADAIHHHQKELHHLRQITDLTGQPTYEPDHPAIPVTISDVEDALRNLADFSRLGDSALSRLDYTHRFYSDEPITHMDRGKAVYATLCQALDKLKPDGEDQRDPPPREWYPYLILKKAYLDDIPNRDIMAHLYISEGTFNRTRRAAIRSIARVIHELETAA